MQDERTVDFWNSVYQDQKEKAPDRTKEWILQPSRSLVEKLASRVPLGRTELRILEIGCGCSTLARDLWLYLTCEAETPGSLLTGTTIHMLATDVSHVCIAQVKARDTQLLATHDGQSHSLAYSVVNVIENHPKFVEAFDVIFDKGCLDTFLFRTKQRGFGQKPYGRLVRSVLDNIHFWLRGNQGNKEEAGVYLVLTIRPKHKSVRDFIGFSSCERYALDLNYINIGDIEGSSEVKAFLYQCRKNTDYSPATHTAFSIDERRYSDSDTCKSCSLTFFEFRKGEALHGRGEAFWFRQWKGHCIHCKL